MYNPIRDGCRGGRDLFKWDDVRLMPYKERECYLGASTKLGFLDRGGKWRKKDWWLKLDAEGEKKMQSEAAELREKEKNEYMEKLGIIKPKKIEQIKPSGPANLSKVEVQEILQRKYDDEQAPNPNEKADRIGGLGYEKKLALYGARPIIEQQQDPALNRLEGVGLEKNEPEKQIKTQAANLKITEKPRKRSRSRSKSIEKHRSDHKHHRHHRKDSDEKHHKKHRRHDSDSD